MNIFHLICHRMPERSFFIKGYQFPVCSRCTGFYISLVLYFIYTYFYYVNYNFKLILLAVLLLVPSFLDGITQFYNLQESNNIRRLITGLCGGLGLGIILKAIKWFLFIYL